MVCPAGIVVFELDFPTALPFESSTVTTTVVIFSTPLVLLRVVYIATVAVFAATFGVVTNTPQGAICTGLTNVNQVCL